MATKTRKKSAASVIAVPIAVVEPPPAKAKVQKPILWIGDSRDRGWLMVPEEFVVCPHEIDHRIRPRHVWLIMRLLAQPKRDYKGDFKVCATWSQLRNAAGRQSVTPQDKKLRSLKGDPSYDSIRKWARDLKSWGLLRWVPGGKRGEQDVASTFDLKYVVTRVEEVRQARKRRQNAFLPKST